MIIEILLSLCIISGALLCLLGNSIGPAVMFIGVMGEILLYAPSYISEEARK